MKVKDIYTDGILIHYDEGDKSLHRKKLTHLEDLDDKAYTIKDGDSLTQLAYRFYGEPLYWYLIADVNNIDIPWVLETGTNIIIPNLKRYGL